MEGVSAPTPAMIVPPNGPFWLRRTLQIALVLSGAGIVFCLHLPARLGEVWAAYFGFNLDTSTSSTFFDNWNAPFPAFVGLVWLVWLLAAMPLLKPASTTLTSQPFSEPRFRFKFQARPIIALLLLVAVLLVAYLQRAAQLLPDASGQLPASNYDEMVYLSGAALWGKGGWPYHDFLLAHPPGALLLFGTFLKLVGQTAGGLAAFKLARVFSLLLGVATSGAVFWVAGRLWAGKSKFALGAGVGAALIYAADVRVSGVAVLETVSNLWAVLAFGAFIEALRLPRISRWHNWLLLLSGFLAALAFLAKLPGLSLFVALEVYLLWQGGRALRQKAELAWLSLGFVIGTVGVGGLFILRGGLGEFLRQVVFFQLLRPQEVRSGIDEVARISDYPESGLTILLASLTIILLTWRLVAARQNISNSSTNSTLWLIPLLWSVPLLAVFIFGKSFHPWYYVQWALPLALLVGGLFQFPDFLSRDSSRKIRDSSFRKASIRNDRANPNRFWYKFRFSNRFKSWGWFLVLGVLMLPGFVTEWKTAHSPTFDQTYQPVADYLHEQGATGPLLSFDPGYAFMAGLEPARLPDGKFLVDSAGYMVYLNLDIDRSGLFSLLTDSLSASRARGQVDAIFHRERAQALVSSGESANRRTVLDVKLGLAQLTPQSVEFLEGAATAPPVKVGSNLIWQARSSGSLREWNFDNGLQLLPLGLSLSQNGRANVLTADDSDTLHPTTTQWQNAVLDLRLVWRVIARPTQPGKLFVHLNNEAGQTVAQSDLAPAQGQANIADWQPGDAYQDVHSLPLPSNLAPGHYTVQIGLYNPVDGQRVLVEGQDSLTLGSLVIGTSR